MAFDQFRLFEEYFRHRARGCSWAASAISWAQSQLDRTGESEHLLILASLPPDSPTAEAEDYFARALRDLGLEAPDEVAECLGCARATAASLLAGEIDPVTCAARVHDLAVSPLNHPDVLQPWCDLDSGFVTMPSGKIQTRQGAELDAEIRSLARRFLDEDPVEQLKAL